MKAKHAFTLVEFLILVVVASILVAIGVSVLKDAKAKQRAQKVQLEAAQDVPSSPINFGSGVYYFKELGAKFPNALAGFLKGHTNLEVTAIAPNVARSAAVGYIVTVREKSPR